MTVSSPSSITKLSLFSETRTKRSVEVYGWKIRPPYLGNRNGQIQLVLQAISDIGNHGSLTVSSYLVSCKLTRKRSNDLFPNNTNRLFVLQFSSQVLQDRLNYCCDVLFIIKYMLSFSLFSAKVSPLFLQDLL